LSIKFLKADISEFWGSLRIIRREGTRPPSVSPRQLRETFRAGAKDERGGGARRQAQQPAFCSGDRALLGSAQDFLQSLQPFTLLVDEQLRVTDDVDEQDMANLEFYI
jgi:hypothetical protein